MLLFIAELIARYYFGLGQLPLYIKSNKYEYIYAPNQQVTRFANRIITNEYSMRSKPLKKTDKPLIFLFGDSVINGGAHVDQDSLCSTLLENSMQQTLTHARVLNISAQSWGPDNAFAYLQNLPNLKPDAIVLVFSSHDFNDNMHFKEVVGKHRAWPDKQPLCALTDALFRYIIPNVNRWIGNSDDEYKYLYGFDDSNMNSGWQNFLSYTTNHNLPLLVCLHAEKNELNNKKFNSKGTRLINWFDAENIKYITDINVLDTTDYRDNIHLNHTGHNKLYKLLLPHLLDFFN
jgi:hypothetical protein